ncbi:MAG: hypothetical protein JO264_13290 [Acidisphaera sp.]|nr:hypothetical protein [Acidisphaera sp.]
MAESLLLLGPVVFQAFEIPERISFGGAQHLAVHRLPGGARVIDALGRDDAEISWSGIFSGGDATERARLLDVLRAAGGVLPLTWDIFYYSAVIAKFEADYRHGWWIPYRITCTVLRDEAQALLQDVASLAVTAVADLGAAAGYAAGAGVDLSAAQNAVGVPGATTLAGAPYNSAVTAVGGAQTQLAGSIATTDAQLGSLDVTNAPALATATSTAGQLASLTAAQGYVSRTAVNLQNAST